LQGVLFISALVGSREAWSQSLGPEVSKADTSLAARLDRVGKVFANKRADYGIPGLAIAIVLGDSVVYAKAFGVRDLESNAPVTTHTMFRIGSSTKAFTSMAIAMSQDSGRMALDASPKKYLPYFRMKDPAADQAVTIRDLLSHRTGISRADNIESTGRLSREELIRILGGAESTAPLREQFQYNNSMYTVAGEALARAEKMRWGDVIRRDIFDPLGMSASNTSFEAMRRTRDFALGYDYVEETKSTPRMPAQELDVIAPAGAVNSNLEDMTRWVRCLVAGGVWKGKRLVSERGFAEMTTRQIRVNPNVEYALGWYVRRWRGHTLLEHAGNTTGYTADVAFMPDQRLGYVILTNQDNAAIVGLAINTILPALVDTAGSLPAAATSGTASSAELSADELTLVGDYRSRFGDGLQKIAALNGQLVIPLGNQTYVLAKRSKDSYGIGSLDGPGLTFRRDSRDSVIALSFTYVYGSQSFDRVGIPAPVQAAEDVMAHMARAIGDSAGIHRHRTLVLRGTVELPTLGVEGEFSRIAEVPDHSSLRVVVRAYRREISTAHYYFNGDSGGAAGSYFPDRHDTPGDLEDERTYHHFFGLADWQALVKRVSIRSVDQVRGDSAYVVSVSFPKAAPEVLYISTRSYRIVASESPGGGITYFDDYRTVDGVNLPFMTTDVAGNGHRRVYQVTSARFDADVAPGEFHP